MEIKLSGVNADPLGIMYFKDGHEEAILYCIEYEDFLITEFHTVSGRYLHYNPGNPTESYWHRSVIDIDAADCHIRNILDPFEEIVKVELRVRDWTAV